MSPRRRIDGAVAFEQRPPRRRRRWGLGLAISAAALIVVAAVAASALVLITHEKDRRAAVREVAAIDYVRSFMTQYTSLDPYHANDYADKVLAQATGELAKMYSDRMNEIVIQVARAEPTKGVVLDAGVERWNDDGSADVVVATQVTTLLPDGNRTESGNRWVATAIQEGNQWKISNLLQVI
ncbi:mammalian cell entry protein [Mycolicibacterium komossense]|uniref:Mammalian cell entry protein n=1 Tax=Mycolicibacterium komossense TaxID=1779 RepID=A0ABT3C8C9_9MYCO|nr:mammalian cell entry protein [Mycolicibacterium komossense]MCV7225727.1 mammalian cell entry protein [Mycolicibacterium komossense]